MSVSDVQFQKQLAFGAVAEGQIANWLRNVRGYSILPVYEIEMHTGKGPRLFAPDRKIVSPDMLAFKTEKIMWIEAKHKSVFSWHRRTQRWVTGIDEHHYEEYIEVSKRFPHQVWLMFLHWSSRPDARDLQYGCPESCPTGLFAGHLDELRMMPNHRHRNHGRHGMVYWAHEKLKHLACLEDLEVQHA